MLSLFIHMSGDSFRLNYESPPWLTRTLGAIRPLIGVIG